MKNIVILGASGNIGQQTLDIIRSFPQEFKLIGVSVGKNIGALKSILSEFKTIKYIVSREKNFEIALSYPQLEYFSGDSGLLKLVSIKECDLVVNALVGFVGFLPSLRTLENDKDLALANKETLVSGGEIIKKTLATSKGKLYPIDSEHSAIWQCLQGNNKKDIRRLIITASGGSLRNKKRSELVTITKKEALNHPTWSMGQKITIDSATMMNKAFEIMEAHYLFDIPYSQIEVLLHKESVVHSLVEYQDGSQLAQLGLADMRLPITYALRYPDHNKSISNTYLDLAKIGSLHFEKLNLLRYPIVKLIKEIAPFGGNFGAVLNGANDVAVYAFLQEKISFLEIEKLVFLAIKKMQFIVKPTVSDILASDAFARNIVNDYLKAR